MAEETKWYQQKDIMLGVGVVAVVAMLIIPIPAFLLDTLMGVSIMLGLVTLLVAMYNRETTDFSVFPTLLLVTTVFRLALNVSSTRLILLQGPGFDGQLVRAFGEFVVGGNYVIGFIIFLILILVQMMVITKGATRISEVSARFTLDALPGKQMSIDSDLSSGLISEEEARRRREKLESEVDFYGQMDGATKFVQGDVRVGLVITAINIVGGFIVGMAVRGETFDTASSTYTLLTIGDGLVAQLPSLLITTATGMVVTRAGSKENMAEEISVQLFRNSRILWMVSGTLLLAALLPGFPTLSLLGLGALIGFLAYSNIKSIEKEEEQQREQQQTEKKSAGPETFIDDLMVDPLKIEIGYSLTPLVQQGSGGNLLERITNLRQRFAREMGMIVPPIRISDNMDLGAHEYAVLIGGTEVARATAFPEKMTALDTGEVSEPLEGEPYKDPTFNLNGVLIEKDREAEARKRGYMVIDANNIIITHLSEVIRSHATDIMGREDVKRIVDKMKERTPTVAEEAVKAGYGVIQSVLHNLLKEGVSIRNMPAILEVIADNNEKTRDPGILTELVRQSIGRQIVSQLWDNGTLNVIQVDPMMDTELREAVTYDEAEGRIYAVNPDIREAMRQSLLKAFNEVQNNNIYPVYLTTSESRMGIVQILERDVSLRQFSVIAMQELPPDTNLNMVAQAEFSEEVISDALR